MADLLINQSFRSNDLIYHQNVSKAGDRSKCFIHTRKGAAMQLFSCLFGLP